jgi:DHA2 family multidrug resistance protein
MQQQLLVEYGSRRVIITITAIICALLEIVDTTIVMSPFYDMKGNLGATTNEIGWVVTAYAIGNVIIIPMTSWLSQQFGKKKLFCCLYNTLYYILLSMREFNLDRRIDHLPFLQGVWWRCIAGNI